MVGWKMEDGWMDSRVEDGGWMDSRVEDGGWMDG